MLVCVNLDMLLQITLTLAFRIYLLTIDWFSLEAAQYLEKTPKLEMKRPINYYSYSKGIYELTH